MPDLRAGRGSRGGAVPSALSCLPPGCQPLPSPPQNGADINAKDMLKMTALHWATEHNHRDVVELLVKCGANVHLASKFGKSAFDIALDKNNPETLLILQVGRGATLRAGGMAPCPAGEALRPPWPFPERCRSLPQEAMQSQDPSRPERAASVPGSVAVGQPFILASGEVVSLASLVSAASTKTTSGRGCPAQALGGGRWAFPSLGHRGGRKAPLTVRWVLSRPQWAPPASPPCSFQMRPPLSSPPWRPSQKLPGRSPIQAGHQVRLEAVRGVRA